MVLAPRTSEFLTELEAEIFLRGHCTKDGLFPAIAGNRNPGALGALEIADLQLDGFRAVILGADDMVEQVGAGCKRPCKSANADARFSTEITVAKNLGTATAADFGLRHLSRAVGPTDFGF